MQDDTNPERMVPAKLHPILRPLVKACVENEIDFEFTGYGYTRDNTFIQCMAVNDGWKDKEMSVIVLAGTNKIKTKLYHFEHSMPLSEREWDSFENVIQYIKETV
jgi:hypothetical protein